MKTLLRSSISLYLFALATLVHGANSFTSIKSGEWSDPAVWSPKGLPGADGVVSVTQATVTLQSDVSVQYLEIDNGELSLNGYDVFTDELVIRGYGQGGIINNAVGGAFHAHSAYLESPSDSTAELIINKNDSVSIWIALDTPNTFLTLKRDLTLTAGLYSWDGVVDIGDYLLSADFLFLDGEQQFVRSQQGLINVREVTIQNTHFRAAPGDVVGSFGLFQSSVAEVSVSRQHPGGLTVENGMLFRENCQLLLSFEALTIPGDWALRWANPVDGNRVDEILSLYDDGKIEWNRETDVIVTDGGDGYTYVMIAVPEPTTFVMIVVGLAAGLNYRSRIRRSR